MSLNESKSLNVHPNVEWWKNIYPHSKYLVYILSFETKEKLYCLVANTAQHILDQIIFWFEILKYPKPTLSGIRHISSKGEAYKTVNGYSLDQVLEIVHI